MTGRSHPGNLTPHSSLLVVIPLDNALISLADLKCNSLSYVIKGGWKCLPHLNQSSRLLYLFLEIKHQIVCSQN